MSTSKEPLNHPAQPWRDRDNAKQPQNPQRPKHREAFRRGDKGNCHDQEVADIPAGTKEPQSLSEDGQHDFQHENNQAQPVENVDQGTSRRHDRVRGLQTLQHRVEQDDTEDEGPGERVFQRSVD